MKLYQLGKGVYQYYRENVKGNEATPHEIVQRKLTRNIALALRVHVERNKFIYLYGNLHIHVNGDKIVKIRNRKMKSDWFYRDVVQYNKINNELGINSENKNIFSQWSEAGDLRLLINEYAQGFTKQN